jgi:hypothetical protein
VIFEIDSDKVRAFVKLPVMGARQSTFHGSQPPTQGLHVLRVTTSSPASYSDIEPFFDFIVGFEGDSLSSDKPINISGLEKIVEGHEGTTLKLLVWNNKTQRTRGASCPIGIHALSSVVLVVPIVPSRVWSQQHIHKDGLEKKNLQPSLLGLSMRLCQPYRAADNVWHVLDVVEGSPAESAGLVPMGDWIVGMHSSFWELTLSTQKPA